MNASKTPGPTDLELYIREPIQPAPYPFFRRKADEWAGRRDSLRLSSAHSGKDPEASVHLSPWARGRQHEYKESCENEENFLNRITDPIRVERAALAAALPRLQQACERAAEAATVAAQTASDQTAAPPEAAAPAGPGELMADQLALAARRRGEKRAADAAASGRAVAAEDAHRAAEDAYRGAVEKMAVIDERLERAREACDHKIAESRRYTARRIAAYARAVAARHPDAPLVTALTAHLDLDTEHPHGAVPGGAARLSIVP